MNRYVLRLALMNEIQLFYKIMVLNKYKIIYEIKLIILHAKYMSIYFLNYYDLVNNYKFISYICNRSTYLICIFTCHLNFKYLYP